MAESTSSSVTAQNAEVQEVSQAIKDKIKATLFGQCIGDALGLLTEFMTKREAIVYYGKKPKTLKYDQKVPDFHRSRWDAGDWTDDTDQMILILQSLLYNKGQIVNTDFAKRIKRWMRQGFPELGDFGGMGIGMTTHKVLEHQDFTKNPHEVASEVWEQSRRQAAPNGGVMRISILGLHQWNDVEKVFENALNNVRCTHFDPRCQASVVAVTTCIAKMLQHADKGGSSKKLPLEEIIKESYNMACRVLETDNEKKELWQHMNCKKLKNLKLEEEGKIGYTYKCMGSGFWALRQENFEQAMIKLIMQGGDADTNGSVAGSMLACKLGFDAIPDHLISGLLHKEMMLDLYSRFIKLQSEMSLPVEEITSNDDLSIENLNALADKYRQEAPERLRKQEEEKKRKQEEEKKKQQGS